MFLSVQLLCIEETPEYNVFQNTVMFGFVFFLRIVFNIQVHTMINICEK